MQKTKKTQSQQTSKRDNKEAEKALGKYTSQANKERKHTNGQTSKVPLYWSMDDTCAIKQSS